MNDEIKEILDRLERIDHKEYSCDFEFADSATFDEMARCFEERKKMADYITNLQQDMKNYVDIVLYQRKTIDNLQQENEYLKKNNPEQNIEHFRIIKENKRKINNLREQNKTLQESNQNMQEEMAIVWEENEKLKQDYINVRNYIKMRNVDTEVEDKALLYNIELENINKKKYLDYKSRCEKAIEYLDKVETLAMLDGKIIFSINIFRNILQNGSDKQCIR